MRWRKQEINATETDKTGSETNPTIVAIKENIQWFFFSSRLCDMVVERIEWYESYCDIRQYIKREKRKSCFLGMLSFVKKSVFMRFSRWMVVSLCLHVSVPYFWSIEIVEYKFFGLKDSQSDFQRCGGLVHHQENLWWDIDSLHRLFIYYESMWMLLL